MTGTCEPLYKIAVNSSSNEGYICSRVCPKYSGFTKTVVENGLDLCEYPTSPYPVIKLNFSSPMKKYEYKQQDITYAAVSQDPKQLVVPHKGLYFSAN